MAFWDRLNPLLGSEVAPGQDQDRLRRAAALLLVEIARADYDDDPAEADAVEHALRAHFGLSAQDAGELAQVARRERDAAVSFEEPVRIINAAFSAADKRQLLRFLWQVAYADGELHRYEEHLLRRICELLHLPHSAFIQTKLEAAQTAG